jgi:hypothetical protein
MLDHDLNPDDPDDTERAELAAEARYLRQYQGRLRRHPNCNDPDHPGCDNCEGDDK